MEVPLQTHASEWFGKRKFFRRHLLLIFLLKQSPFFKTLTQTGSSVTADLGMVQNDSLESVSHAFK